MNIKNKECLKEYSRIKEYIDKVELRINENDLDGGFINLRRVIESIDDELVRRDDWYKSKVKLLSRPSSEEIIKHLKDEGVLTVDQADLFNSIRWLANKYVHGKNDESKWNADFESLRNFTVRLDKELPSLVSKMEQQKNSYFSSNNKTKIDLSSFFRRMKESTPDISNEEARRSYQENEAIRKQQEKEKSKKQAEAFSRMEQIQIESTKKKIKSIKKERFWIYVKTLILFIIAVLLIVFIVKNKHNTEFPIFSKINGNISTAIEDLFMFLAKLSKKIFN